MKFRNPWIDPRVTELRPELIRAYLTGHGWSEVGLAQDPSLLRFERTTYSSDAPTLFLPLRPGTAHGLQSMIELVGDLATWQDRFAGEVVSELLASNACNGTNEPVGAPSSKTTAAT